MAKKNKGKNKKKALNPSIYNVVNEKYLPQDIFVQVKEIKRLINDIKMLDSRWNVVRIEKQYLSIGKISQFMEKGRNPEVGRKIIEVLKEVKRNLENPIKETSDEELTELKKRVVNLIKNKNYSQSEISRMLGKSRGYVSMNLSGGQINPLKNIEDFVKLLPYNENVVEKETSDKLKENKVSSTLNTEGIADDSIPVDTPDNVLAVKIGSYYISEIRDMDNILVTKNYSKIANFTKEDAVVVSSQVEGKVMRLSEPKVVVRFKEEIEGTE